MSTLPAQVAPGRAAHPPVGGGRVLNRRDLKGGQLPPGAVYVGRPSAWANPYRMRAERDRERVLREFEAYARGRLAREPRWLEPLRGKALVCWCAPAKCHADILLQLLAEMDERKAS